MNAFLRPPAKTILLVDHDAENRAFLRSEFEARGFFVVEAESSVQAIELARGQKTDAALIDLELSREEKRTLIGSLVSETFGTPMVFLLVAASSMTREEAYALGAAAAFSKPLDPDYIATRIHEALVPASTRWLRGSAVGAAIGGARVRSSLPSLNLGRGGFALPLGADENERLEGELVEFDVEVREESPWHLKGTGFIRYVKLDSAKRRPQAWGIEFNTLDEISFRQVMSRNESRKPLSYIPPLYRP